MPPLQHNQLLPQTKVFRDWQRLWPENGHNG
jgi:hypothetical protein